MCAIHLDLCVCISHAYTHVNNNVIILYIPVTVSLILTLLCHARLPQCVCNNGTSAELTCGPGLLTCTELTDILTMVAFPAPHYIR